MRQSTFSLHNIPLSSHTTLPKEKHMTDIIIENLVRIAAALLLMLVGVLGTYLTALAGRRAETANLREALDGLTAAARTTVLELQQTTVEPLKAAAADGKLTEAEITALRALLLQKTREKLLPSTLELINAAGADVEALITGAAESLIAGMK